MKPKVLLSLILATVATAASLQAHDVLTGATLSPYKLSLTPGGNVVVAEGGTGHDDGRVSLVSRWGARHTLLAGLPSSIAESFPTGPTAVADAHRTLYILIGEGDVRGVSAPPVQVPNPDGLSSPIFSSILRARFDPVPDGIRTGFTLAAEHIRALADGRTVTLDNSAGESVELELLTDFRDLDPDPVTSLRSANPFSLTLVGSLTADDLIELGDPSMSVEQGNFAARLHPDSPLGRRLEERTRLYGVDSGLNTVIEVAAATGRWRVVARLAPIPNPLFPGLGGPVVDAVPTAVCATGSGTLLVSLLTGFPFASGLARVAEVDPATGEISEYLGGLTTATDVTVADEAIYVLELSTDFLGQAPGRLLRFDDPGAAPVVVAGGLIGPTGVLVHPRWGQLVVSESFTGRLLRLPLPR
ncbi:MAG: ScyD/ScyE family protein [Thermoanaerobaculales bacterium]|jgi:hypothetical protein|nr:ScyD/ScyE family protein [Thermoanaerobaculales bacterium]